MKNSFGFPLRNMFLASRHWAEQPARGRPKHAWAVTLVFFSAPAMCMAVTAPACRASPAVSSQAAGRDFVVRFKDGKEGASILAALRDFLKSHGMTIR